MRLLTISWLVFFSLVLGLRGQTIDRTNHLARSISLEESIDMALKGNLGVEIERINKQIAGYNLAIGYAGWDPFLSASASHSFNSTPSGFDNLGRVIPSTRSDSDNIAAGLGGPGVGVGGLLPSGLTYSLSGNASDTVFHRPIVLTNGVFDTRTETTRGGVTLNLSQPLLKNAWIDATRRNVFMYKNRLQWSDQNFRLAIMKAVNETAKNYYELIYARTNVEVLEKALELAMKLAEENRKKVQVGTMAPLDEKSAESQAATAKALLLDAQRAKLDQENVLKRLLSANYSALHDIELLPSDVLAAPIPVLNLKQSWAEGMAQRPDLLQARLDIEQQNIVLRYTYNQLFPELDLIGSYGFAGSGREFSGAFGRIASGSDPNYSFGVSVTIPLGNRVARGIYAGSKEQKKYYLLLLKSLEQDILVQIENGVRLVQTSFDEIETTRRARIFAQAALDAEQKKLESGKSTPYLVLQAQRDLTSSRKDEIRALANYHKALSDLYFQEGSILEKHHLGVGVK